MLTAGDKMQCDRFPSGTMCKIGSNFGGTSMRREQYALKRGTIAIFKAVATFWFVRYADSNLGWNYISIMNNICTIQKEVELNFRRG